MRVRAGPNPNPNPNPNPKPYPYPYPFPFPFPFPSPTLAPTPTPTPNPRCAFVENVNRNVLRNDCRQFARDFNASNASKAARGGHEFSNVAERMLQPLP